MPPLYNHRAVFNHNERRNTDVKYECICGYVYDESAGDSGLGIEPGTKWDDLPDDFSCPVCGLGKDDFSQA